MTDQKTKNAKPDRSLIEGGEDHEVRELAVATGLSVDEASSLVERHGDNPEKLTEEAQAMREQAQEKEEAARR